MKKLGLEGECSQESVTTLLSRYREGDPTAFNRVYAILRRKLRQMALKYLQAERAGHTLQPTDLVHEALESLLDRRTKEWSNRNHFLAVAALAMRQILVSHARRKRAQKRSGGVRISIEGLPIPAESKSPDVDLILLDDLLKTLSEANPRQHHVVELKFFGGLTIKEISEIMGISERTVDREWQAARVWIYHELKGAKQREAA